MTKANLAACLTITLGYEGGFTANKSDPGNWTGGKVGVGSLKGTKFGISAAAFPQLDIRNLTIADVQPIYKRQYWDEVSGDDLPAGLDLVSFDYGVNSGPARAVSDLQRVVGAPADGKAGPLTLAAVGKADTVAAIKSLCAKRLGYLQHLKIWNSFGKGWAARVANVEARGVAMFLASSAASPALARAALLDESEAADTKATGNIQAAGTGATGGVIGGGASDHSTLMIALAVGMTALVIGVFVMMYQKNKARADAYKAAADAMPLSEAPGATGSASTAGEASPSPAE
jgi:lysozyme family protein